MFQYKIFLSLFTGILPSFVNTVMVKVEQCVLLLLVCYIKIKRSTQIISTVTQDCKSPLPDKWWAMHYFKILKQTYHLLVLSETIPHNDPMSQYITILLHQIHMQEITPVTKLIIMSNKCSQSFPIPKQKFVLLLAVNKKALFRLFQNAEICIHQWDTKAHFTIIVLNHFFHEDETKEKSIALSIFKDLWTKERVLNVLIVTRHSHFSCEINENTNNSIKVWMYNPFEVNANNSRGNIYNFEYGHDLSNAYTHNRLRNVHEYQLQVSMFTQYPTAIPVNNVNNNSTTYEGMDGHILSNMAQYFNFKLKVHTTYGNNPYGSVLQNGSVMGSLADVAYGRTEISFNSRFIMWYGIDIDFSIPVTSDKLCIIARKAKRIPKWKNMLVCYKTEVWLSLLMVYVVCAMCFYFLHKYQLQKHSTGCLPTLHMFQIFVLSPVHHPPRILMQQLLFASCLLFNLVLMNTFQGLLVTNITTPNYGTDIHTLDQLDQSNFQILTGSSSAMDLLKNGGYVISRKFKVFEGTREEMIQQVLKSAAAITERESSIRFLVTKYVSPDGTLLMHMVEECPAYYYLAYILPKGSPYLQEFNSFLRKVMESGLTQKWYWDSIDIKTRLSYRKSHPEPKTLKLFSVSDLQLAFYILATGLLLSSFIFVVEVALATRKVQ